MNATVSPHTLHERISRALQAGAFTEAERLLESAPHDVNFDALRGIHAQQTGDYASALHQFEAVLAKQPNSPGVMMNRAMVLGALKRHDEALGQLNAILAIVPSASVYALMAEIYKETGQSRKAVDAMKKAMDLGMRAPEFVCNYWMGTRDICDWSEPLPAFAPSDLTPAAATVLCEDPTFQRQVAEYFCRTRFPQTLPAPSLTPTAGRRLRVGYISGDIHTHATAFLIAELFELHDRNTFEVTCLSYSADDGSAIRRRIAGSAEHFIDAHKWPLADRVAALRAANLDILVDLKGHTRNDALVVMAMRTAPIQIHYLGHPGTTGAPFIDYLVGDSIVTPPENDEFYSEKIIRLPHCYQINDRARAVATAKTRRDYGLPDDAVVLASFNQTHKITPEMFATWMEILRARPNTVLWTFGKSADVRENLQKEAEKAGISASRLHFAAFIPNDEHMARYHVVDVMMDTYPYNGHTTTSDALWVGAPVVTLMGQSYPSRVAASLLTNVGLGELITKTPEEYKEKIVSLIDTPAERTRVRQHLQNSRAAFPLFDTVQWVRDWETALLNVVATRG